ncbi:MAG: CsbD family protein [Chloroflexi bacterium]|nr:CsbD family protein [Chloroflexota bacterium]
MALEDVLKGNWNKFKGRVKEEWGDLTDDDLTQIEGSRDVLIGKIQERYGLTKLEAEQEVADFIERQDKDVF